MSPCITRGSIPRGGPGSLSLPDTRRLHAAIRAILHDAIETGGTSFAGYVNDFRGRPGYLDHAEVFRQQGQPCQACGTMIVRTRVADRATNLCPRCQIP